MFNIDLGLGLSLLFLCDRVLRSPGWLQTHLGSQIFCLTLPKAGITGAPPRPICSLLEILSRALGMTDKHSIDFATAPVHLFRFWGFCLFVCWEVLLGFVLGYLGLVWFGFETQVHYITIQVNP